MTRLSPKPADFPPLADGRAGRIAAPLSSRCARQSSSIAARALREAVLLLHDLTVPIALAGALCVVARGVFG